MLDSSYFEVEKCKILHPEAKSERSVIFASFAFLIFPINSYEFLAKRLCEAIWGSLTDCVKLYRVL